MGFPRFNKKKKKKNKHNPKKNLISFSSRAAAAPHTPRLKIFPSLPARSSPTKPATTPPLPAQRLHLDTQPSTSIFLLPSPSFPFSQPPTQASIFAAGSLPNSRSSLLFQPRTDPLPPSRLRQISFLLPTAAPSPSRSASIFPFSSR